MIHLILRLSQTQQNLPSLTNWPLPTPLTMERPRIKVQKTLTPCGRPHLRTMSSSLKTQTTFFLTPSPQPQSKHLHKEKHPCCRMSNLLFQVLNAQSGQLASRMPSNHDELAIPMRHINHLSRT